MLNEIQENVKCRNGSHNIRVQPNVVLLKNSGPERRGLFFCFVFYF